MFAGKMRTNLSRQKAGEPAAATGLDAVGAVALQRLP